VSETFAVFVIAPVPGVTEEATFTRREIVPATSPVAAVDPELPELHDTVPLAFAHAHPVPEAETKPSPVGSTSLTVIGSAAGSGPLFVTTIEYMPFAPETKAVPFVFAIDRSA
jgi:hypothetical protein